MRPLLKGKEILLLALSALTIVFAAAGCASTEDDNLSERPWNAPKTWETGIPQSMQQGR